MAFRRIAYVNKRQRKPASQSLQIVRYGGTTNEQIGKQIFEEYAVGTPHDRFVLIYNNYGVLENVIRSYEHSVFKQIRDEKEYNRKHRSA